MAEYKLARALGRYIQLSPSWIYWYARAARGWTSQDQGSFIRDAMEACMTRGVCLNSFMPFRDANGAVDVFTAPTEHAKVQASRHRFVNARRIDRTQVLDALASGNVVVGGFTVYEHCWFGEEALESGIVRMPRHHNDFGGGHAVALAGYDKSRGTAHGPGSWGDTHWGVHSRYRAGWHEIDLDYIYKSDMSSDFWTLDYLEGVA